MMHTYEEYINHQIIKLISSFIGQKSIFHAFIKIDAIHLLKKDPISNRTWGDSWGNFLHEIISLFMTLIR